MWKISRFLIILLCAGLVLTLAVFTNVENVSEIPLLKEEPDSKSYQLRFLHNPYRANITFDQHQKFFISEGDQYIKIDAKGRDVFRLRETSESFRAPFSSFVVTTEGIFNFADDKPQAKSIDQIVDGEKNKTFKKESFDKVFEQAYRDAEVFFIGEYDYDVSKTASYFRIDGVWIKFYLGNNSGKIIQNSDLGEGLKGFPAKYRRMTLLKDVARNQYSNNGVEVFRTARPLLEASVNYAETPSLETISFSSDYVSEKFAYTPIPAIFGGFGHYRLSVGGDKIDFKEIATRQVLSWHIDTHMNLFVLPAKEAHQVEVSFIEFNPLNNQDTNQSDGIYIVSPKVIK